MTTILTMYAIVYNKLIDKTHVLNIFQCSALFYLKLKRLLVRMTFCRMARAPSIQMKSLGWVLRHVFIDHDDQLGHAWVKTLSRGVAEVPSDHVQPRRQGECEVHVEPRMLVYCFKLIGTYNGPFCSYQGCPRNTCLSPRFPSHDQPIARRDRV